MAIFGARIHPVPSSLKANREIGCKAKFWYSRVLTCTFNASTMVNYMPISSNHLID